MSDLEENIRYIVSGLRHDAKQNRKEESDYWTGHADCADKVADELEALLQDQDN